MTLQATLSIPLYRFFSCGLPTIGRILELTFQQRLAVTLLVVSRDRLEHFPHHRNLTFNCVLPFLEEKTLQLAFQTILKEILRGESCQPSRPTFRPQAPSIKPSGSFTSMAWSGHRIRKFHQLPLGFVPTRDTPCIVLQLSKIQLRKLLSLIQSIYIYIHIYYKHVISCYYMYVLCISGYVTYTPSVIKATWPTSFDSGIKGALTYAECANNWCVEMG